MRHWAEARRIIVFHDEASPPTAQRPIGRQEGTLAAHREIASWRGDAQACGTLSRLIDTS
jgi:hypothetical protein